jgi:hypothetical protein
VLRQQAANHCQLFRLLLRQNTRLCVCCCCAAAAGVTPGAAAAAVGVCRVVELLPHRALFGAWLLLLLLLLLLHYMLRLGCKWSNDDALWASCIVCQTGEAGFAVVLSLGCC